jgi:uncharacterized membrane protein YdjX (TVP38/TMEM64 family)
MSSPSISGAGVTETASQNKKQLWTSIAGWLGFLLFLLLIRQLPLREWLLPALSSLGDSGIRGILIFVAVGIALTSLFLPVSLLVFSAGMVFGVRTGFLLASVILLTGTGTGFVGGRFLWTRIRDWPMFRNRVFRAVRDAIEQEGLYLITFLRLTPFFHFMTGNIFFGSLNLRFFPYLLYSYLGMIPGTLLVAYAGSVTTQTLDEEQAVSLWQGLLFGAGILIFSWVSWRITLTTRRILESNQESS